MELALVTGPTSEPVTLAEARAHVRVSDAEEDGLLAGYLLAARDHVERILGRSLMVQTWDMFIESWPECLEIPKPPLQSVTSIQYVSGGATQTLAADQYVVRTGLYVGRIDRAANVCWPHVDCTPRAISIRFVAGYGDAPSDIPEGIRQAILMLVGYWFDNRSTVNVGSNANQMPFAVDALLAAHRVY
jgi:uncharacterized phiE125 gp8 family phage protein